MPVTIGALRESAPQEARVSLVPEVADKLVKEGARVLLSAVPASAPDSRMRCIKASPGRTAPQSWVRPTCWSPCSPPPSSRSRS